MVVLSLDIEVQDRIPWIRSRVRSTDHVLEVGCADNPVWRNTGIQATLLDLPHDNDADPDKKIPPHVYATAERLPFSDNCFDVVSACEILEHVKHPEYVLGEALRVARRLVVITVPNEWLWPPELLPFGHGGHIRFYNDETFLNVLKPLNKYFRAIKLCYCGWSWFGAEIFKYGDFKNSPVSHSLIGETIFGRFKSELKFI